MIPAHERIAGFVALLITAVWTASVILDAAWKAYDPPATVHALMMAVAGWAFGSGYLARRGRRFDEDEGLTRDIEERRANQANTEEGR